MNLLQRLGRGLEAGWLAGCGVAVLFFAADVVRLAPLESVLELASVVPEGIVGLEAAGPAWTGVAVATAAVALYSLLHFAVFGALGVAATWFVPVASFWATLARGAAFGVVACSAAFLVGRAWTGSPYFPEAVSPTGLVLTNAMAGVIMAAVFAVHVSAAPEASDRI